MTIKAALFDLDGTLIDSMPALRKLAIDQMTIHYSILEKYAASEYDRTMGYSFHEQLTEIFGENEAKKNGIVYGIYIEDKKQSTLDAAVIPEVLSLVLRYKLEGLRTGVVSSTDVGLVEQVIAKRFSNFLFDNVTGYGWGNKPEQIKSFLRKYNLRPDEVVYYGDTNNDQKIAEEIGLGFVMVNNGSLAQIP